MSLYRTYRPLTFADVVGQEGIKQTLQNEIIHERTVHAYLFSGPRAIGKTTTARIFSRAINCLSRQKWESEPCNSCDSCQAILSGRALDVLEIDAASHTGVDNVRENIIAASRVANSFLKVKTFIIDEVHMLSQSAFNALLKVLEEPPARVVFILATTELHKVPATVVSRCQRFEFKKIPAVAMAERLKKLVVLEKKFVDDEVINDIVRVSDGCERDAESLLGQVLSLGEKRIDSELAALVLPHSNMLHVKELAKLIIAKEIANALNIIDTLREDGTDIETFTNDVLEYFHSMLRIKHGVGDILDLTLEEKKIMEDLVTTVTIDKLLAIIDTVMRAQQEGKWSSIPELPLEIAIIKSCL